jgi:hypothetical protein
MLITINKTSKKMVVKGSKKRGENRKQPKIVVIDIKMKSEYYRVTKIQLKNKERYYINWQTKSDFKRGYARLKRHESTQFTDNDIVDISTKTHRYASSSFTAKGFKP